MTTMKQAALAATIAAAMFANASFAKVDASEAAKLGVSGTPLTPLGAERVGNAEGTIPAWTGGITQPPSGYKAGMHHPDPFPGDKPTMTITAANHKEHAAKLTAGQIAMFEKYPDWKMVVYPTRRTSSSPARIYEMTIKNATTGELVGGGNGVTNVAEGIPFPILSKDPAMAGAEAIWNHKLKYKGVSLQRWANQAPVTAGGQYVMVRIKEELLGLYYKQGATLSDINNILVYFYQEVVSPPRLAGQVLLVHESLNSETGPRQAWVYNPGQRRVRRAPNIAYDNPGTAADNLRTTDMTDMYNGALDRFDWKLVGKQETYVPYNSYKAHSNESKIADMVKPGYINPDYLRYELHRTYVVEATVKAGQRHINPKRTFYLDEDSWQILVVDHYDGQGNLWRYSEAPSVNYYEVPVVWSTMENHHDLKSGRYISVGLDNEDRMYDFSFQTTPDMFSPQSLRQRGIQ